MLSLVGSRGGIFIKVCSRSNKREKKRKPHTRGLEKSPGAAATLRNIVIIFELAIGCALQRREHISWSAKKKKRGPNMKFPRAEARQSIKVDFVVFGAKFW